MRSHVDTRLSVVTLTALLMGVPSVCAADAVRTPAPAMSGVPGRDEIVRAMEAVKADPNLVSERTIKTLRRKNSGTKSIRPAWLEWLVGLIGWIDQSARVLVWCAAVVLAGLAVTWIARMVRPYRRVPDDETFVAPTHVRDLDIRPETLPTDIGAAARALWDSDARRPALALLYRGLLSRLAHVHRLPIRDSTTEGDCVALAVTLPPTRHEYASRLVGAWQQHTYGCREIRTSIVHALCDDFASLLDSSAPLDSHANGEVA